MYSLHDIYDDAVLCAALLAASAVSALRCMLLMSMLFVLWKSK